MALTEKKIVWHIQDASPGHENQVLGFIQALQAKIPLKIYSVLPLSPTRAVWNLLWDSLFSPLPNPPPQGGRGQDTRSCSREKGEQNCPPSPCGRGLGGGVGEHLPRPDLIIGAGHNTHLSILAAKRAYGGKTIVLMKPTLPLCFFDLCIIPGHDNPPRRPNVLVTQGVLNRVRPNTQPRLNCGLLLMGGLSEHYQWDNQRLLEQIQTIVLAAPEVHWTVTTSRRTPSDFVAILKNKTLPALQCMSFENTPDGWLLPMLNQCGQIWVTPDSVSMVYEALTSGAHVGILDLVPTSKLTRVQKGLAQLILSKTVCSFQEWGKTKKLIPQTTKLDEATRVAEWVVQTWFH